MSSQQVLTQEIVKYLMENYKDLLKEVVYESVDSGTIPEMQLVYRDGTLHLEITYKETK